MLSRSNARLVHALKQRKTRETQGLFLAEGVRVAEELAASDIDLEFALVSTTLGDTPRGHTLQSVLSKRTAVHVLRDDELKAAAATENAQGVLAVARVPRHTLDSLAVPAPARVLICDGVQDPGNLGTLIRSADAFAFHAVLLLPGSVDAWNPKVVRAAAGSSFHLPIVTGTFEQLPSWLRAQEFYTLGAAADGVPFERSQVRARTSLVVGNEGAGLRAETQALVDRSVRIDMPGPAESLNVGVAAGILMYLLTHGDT
jgi:TrmH family RNA methyltransferase